MWFDNFTKDLPIHTILWLQTDPTLCLDRIHIRNRKGEEKIQTNYLERLAKAHDDWLEAKHDTIQIIKVEPTMSLDDICKKYIDIFYSS